MAQFGDMTSHIRDFDTLKVRALLNAGYEPRRKDFELANSLLDNIERMERENLKLPPDSIREMMAKNISEMAGSLNDILRLLNSYAR